VINQAIHIPLLTTISFALCNVELMT
jgi:hypothetical protein